MVLPRPTFTRSRSTASNRPVGNGRNCPPGLDKNNNGFIDKDELPAGGDVVFEKRIEQK